MRLPNWNLTFSAKRRLQRAGLITAIVVMVLILIWFCWVIFAQRYVVYTRDGAIYSLRLHGIENKKEALREAKAILDTLY